MCMSGGQRYFFVGLASQFQWVSFVVGYVGALGLFSLLVVVFGKGVKQ